MTFAVVEPLAGTLCERFGVVEPLAGTLCERFGVVEPLAGTLCERFGVVEPPAGPPCERFAVVEPPVATPCERFGVVEPPAGTLCERFGVVEPPAGTLCERFGVVEPPAGPPCERFAVVEPPAGPLCERFAVIEPLAALLEPLVADGGRFRGSAHPERHDLQWLSMTRKGELRARPGACPGTRSADDGTRKSPGRQGRQGEKGGIRQMGTRPQGSLSGPLASLASWRFRPAAEGRVGPGSRKSLAGEVGRQAGGPGRARPRAARPRSDNGPWCRADSRRPAPRSRRAGLPAYFRRKTFSAWSTTLMIALTRPRAVLTRSPARVPVPPPVPSAPAPVPMIFTGDCADAALSLPS